MKKLVIFCVISGPDVYLPNLNLLQDSIQRNVGLPQEEYCFYIVSDKVDCKEHVEASFPENSILEVVIQDVSWAQSFNEFLSKYEDSFEYLIITHDDITVNTENFFQKTIEVMQGKEDKIGWITYTNTAHHPLGANSVRQGFCFDRLGLDTFECHNQGTIDYPEGPVVVYGPYSHFNFISMKSMKIAGPCHGLNQKYTMLIDEDWCLCTVTRGLFNVWIPDIFYHHHRTRKSNLRYEREAHEAFIKRWGFDLPPTDSDIENVVLKKWPQLEYLCHHFTYDWIYLKDLVA